MVKVPKRPAWVYSGFDFSLEVLKNYLIEAQSHYPERPRELMRAYLENIRHYLVWQEISKHPQDQNLADWEDLLEPLDRLINGLTDLQGGFRRDDLFEPTSSVAHTIPIEEATNKAMAAAAITLAPRGEKTAFVKEAANRLGVKDSTVMNFRENLSRGRIKSAAAVDTYNFHIQMARRLGTDRETALWLLSLLKPVTKRSDLD